MQRWHSPCPGGAAIHVTHVAPEQLARGTASLQALKTRNFMKRMIMAMLTVAALTTSVSSQALEVGSEAGAGAAGGYCLGKHPYWQRDSGGGWTADGYETAGVPGIVAAVRRNYVFGRGDGERQSCPQACAQWGKTFPAEGRSLRQIIYNSGALCD